MIMSMTLIGVAIAGISTGLKLLQESGVNLNAVAKMSKPAVREIARETDKKVKEYENLR